MIKQPEILPLGERYKMACTDNMNLRGGLRDIIVYCDKIKNGEIVGTLDYLIDTISNIASEVLR